MTPRVVSDLGGVMANIRDFGVTGRNPDESVLFQQAIDYAANHGLTLYIPVGSYRADGLILRDNTRIVGAGPDLSVIRSVMDSQKESLFSIDAGSVRSVLLSRIGIEAAGGSGEQHGLHIAARRGPDDTASGLWHSDFENIRVYNFGGAQLWLQGGGQDARDPIQFLTFRNVVLERRNDSARSIALLASGQVNQTYWLGGRIDGFGSSGDHLGANMKICRQLDRYDPSVDGSSEYVSNRSGHSHLFADVSFQQADLAAYIDSSESITFDTCHFEGLKSGLLFSGGGANRVDRSHFANSGLDADVPYAIRAENGAVVTGSTNVFRGDFGTMAVVDDAASSIMLSNSVSNEGVTSRNVTKRLTADDTIDVGFATTVVLDPDPLPVRNVTSNHYPGDQIVLKAIGGSVFFGAGGNIDFEGTVVPVEVTKGGTLTLVRMDFGPEWSVVATHGVRAPNN